jgi:hypothetical protein
VLVPVCLCPCAPSGAVCTTVSRCCAGPGPVDFAACAESLLRTMREHGRMGRVIPCGSVSSLLLSVPPWCLRTGVLPGVWQAWPHVWPCTRTCAMRCCHASLSLLVALPLVAPPFDLCFSLSRRRRRIVSARAGCVPVRICAAVLTVVGAHRIRYAIPRSRCHSARHSDSLTAPLYHMAHMAMWVSCND